MADRVRNKRGRFTKNREKEVSLPNRTLSSVREDHCYNKETVVDAEINTDVFINDNWQKGRRLIELSVLLKNLQYCQHCQLGPVPLTINNVVGELQKGLSGYLYVQCGNVECRFVNRVAYGKTHRVRKSGMPCFDVNTKLGAAMIDNIGGSNRVNNFLSTLNIHTMSSSSLKKMERRAGVFVEHVSKESCTKAAKETFEKEMQDISKHETEEAMAGMENFISDLGVGTLQDSSPQIIKLLQEENYPCKDDGQWSESDNDLHVKMPKRRKVSNKWKRHMVNNKIKTRLSYPCKTRSGMSCAVDTAWQKKGFDSLTSHTFFMGKAKYGKK